ncbi:uncharacterized protein IUM83_08989 [Phytophthora cinnamomi]|uniref:uncharacterized protein n=1 Tax=Phytophthora cinnamomi TaxID=4785 RepID=UPI003559A747|nr:hypothetical protein IUM83_08989 [Phytophthora cinnamomi]
MWRSACDVPCSCSGATAREQDMRMAGSPRREACSFSTGRVRQRLQAQRLRQRHCSAAVATDVATLECVTATGGVWICDWMRTLATSSGVTNNDVSSAPEDAAAAFLSVSSAFSSMSVRCGQLGECGPLG